jgi:hypothetical protein
VVALAAVAAVMLTMSCEASATTGLTYLGTLNGFSEDGQASPMAFTDELVAVNGDTATNIWRKYDLGSTPIFVGPPSSGRTRNQVGLAGYGDYIFAGAYGYQKITMGSLITIDVSDPANVHVANIWQPDGIKFGRLIRKGNMLYGTFHFAGLLTIDITNPLDPQFMDVYGNIADPFNGTDNIALHGNYIYAGTQQDRVDIYNVADPYNILKVGSITTNSGNRWIDIYGDYLYVGYEYGMYPLRIVDIYDISDVSHIHRVGYFDANLSATVHSFAFCDHYAFFVENCAYPWNHGSFGVHMVDIADPAHPVEVDFYDTSDRGALYGDLGGCGIDGNRLYVPDCTNHTIMVFEIETEHVVIVPEPASISMLFAGLSGIALLLRLRKK